MSLDCLRAVHQAAGLGKLVTLVVWGAQPWALIEMDWAAIRFGWFLCFRLRFSVESWLYLALALVPLRL
jgi:hypothetical protein